MGQKISTNTNNDIKNEHQDNLEQQFEVLPSTNPETNLESILDTISETNIRSRRVSEIDSAQLQSVKLKPVVQNKYEKIDHIKLRSVKLKPTTQNKRFKIDHILLRSIKLKPLQSKPIRPKPIQKLAPLPKKFYVNIEENLEKENLEKENLEKELIIFKPEVPTMVRNETEKPFPKTMKEYYGVHKKKVKFNNNISIKSIPEVKEVKEIKETKSKGTPTVEETVEVVYDLFLEKFSHLANNDKNKKIIHELCEISVNNMPDKVSNPTYYLNFIESSIKSIKQSNQNLENF